MFKKKTIKHVHFLHGHFKNSNTVGMGDDRFVWWWVGGGGNGFVWGGAQGRRSYSLIFLLMCDSLERRYLHLFFLIS